MKEILEALWNEYFLDKCSVMDTEEERRLMSVAADLHEHVRVLLNKEQEEALERYVDALYKIEVSVAKKAFFKGCEFAVSFLFESGNVKK